MHSHQEVVQNSYRLQKLVMRMIGICITMPDVFPSPLLIPSQWRSSDWNSTERYRSVLFADSCRNKAPHNPGSLNFLQYIFISMGTLVSQTDQIFIITQSPDRSTRLGGPLPASMSPCQTSLHHRFSFHYNGFLLSQTLCAVCTPKFPLT